MSFFTVLVVTRKVRHELCGLIIFCAQKDGFKESIIHDFLAIMEVIP